MDEIVSPLILQEQTPYQILVKHSEIKCNEKTLCNYIASGALSIKNIDLLRKDKYIPHKSHVISYINNTQTYPDANIVE